MNNNIGFVKLEREIYNKLKSNANLVNLYCYLLVNAKLDEEYWAKENITIPKNGLITSQRNLAKELGLTKAKVINLLEKLRDYRLIDVRGCNKFTLIICNQFTDQFTAKKQPKNDQFANQKATNNTPVFSDVNGDSQPKNDQFANQKATDLQPKSDRFTYTDKRKKKEERRKKKEEYPFWWYNFTSDEYRAWANEVDNEKCIWDKDRLIPRAKFDFSGGLIKEGFVPDGVFYSGNGKNIFKERPE